MRRWEATNVSKRRLVRLDPTGMSRAIVVDDHDTGDEQPERPMTAAERLAAIVRRWNGALARMAK